VEREDIELAQCNPLQPENLHVQLPCRVVSDHHGAGIGVFEQLILGPYAPMGLKEYFDAG
jgi:hypothetical protein